MEEVIGSIPLGSTIFFETKVIQCHPQGDMHDIEIGFTSRKPKLAKLR